MTTTPDLPTPDLLETLVHYLLAGRRIIVTAAHPEQHRALALDVLRPLAQLNAERGDVLERVTAKRIDLRNGGHLIQVQPRANGETVRGMSLDVAVLLDVPADHPFRTALAPALHARDGFVLDVATDTL